jgi:hypothetical protein
MSTGFLHWSVFGSALLDLIASYNSKLIMKPLRYWYESFDRGCRSVARPPSAEDSTRKSSDTHPCLEQGSNRDCLNTQHPVPRPRVLKPRSVPSGMFCAPRVTVYYGEKYFFWCQKMRSVRVVKIWPCDQLTEIELQASEVSNIEWLISKRKVINMSTCLQ